MADPPVVYWSGKRSKKKMAIAERPFRGEADLPAVVELRREIAAVTPGSLPVSESELREKMLGPVPDWKQEYILWEEDGSLDGMLEVHTSELPDSDPVVYLGARVRPVARERGLGEAMIARGEELARQWRGVGAELEISSLRDSTWAVSLIERMGFVPARVFERMAMELSAPVLPEPAASGYYVRPLAGVDEVDAWNAVYNVAFRDHYDFHAITRQQRLRYMEQPSHVPEFDLVAAALDGSMAAFCWIIRRDEDDGGVTWVVDLVGTHPEHRRRGLAGALISAGLAGIQERGGRRVLLEVDSNSPTGANRLYERLGFRVETAMIDFRKRL
jgi:mycothiol synthase